jgi:integrase/recombinase XerD
LADAGGSLSPVDTDGCGSYLPLVEGNLEQYLSSRSYSTASERQRRSIIGAFLRVAPSPVEVNAEDVVAWWQGTAHLAPASRRAHLMAVRGYMRWLVAVGVRTDDPTMAVRAPTVHRAPPKVLTPEQVERLRAAAMSDRERLVVGLMLDLGLRVGEVARLSASDVQGATVAVHGKGGKVAVLPFPAHLAALMPSQGRVVDCTPSALSWRVVKLLRRCGIGGHTAHSLRRTAATEWSRRGVQPHVIAALLRHSSVATSAHYVAIGADDMAAAVGSSA